MLGKVQCSQNKKNGVASICIKSLRQFNEICFEKLEQIIKLFKTKKLFFDLEVFEKDKEAICTALRDLDKNSKLEIFFEKHIGHIAYQSSTENLLRIFKIIEKYKLEESTFFEPKDYTWEQYLNRLTNGTLENELSKCIITNVLFSVYGHDGYHNALFRVDKHDYDETITKIKTIINKTHVGCLKTTDGVIQQFDGNMEMISYLNRAWMNEVIDKNLYENGRPISIKKFTDKYNRLKEKVISINNKTFKNSYIYIDEGERLNNYVSNEETFNNC